MRQYKIGDVAKLLGLTTQALRFYEQEGVISPVKSESGTRYYTFDELHKLLSVKKYRMAEFTVQDIVQHLKQDSLHALSDQLDDKCDELIARSEELLRRAQALRQFRHEVDKAELNLGILTECMRPQLHALKTVINDLDELTPREKREMHTYIEALPATSIAFTQDIRLKTLPQFFMCVSAERASRWELSLENTRIIPSVRCISTYAYFPGSYHDKAPIREVLHRIEEKGYTLNKDEPILSLHVASDVHDGVTHICGQLFIPVL